MSMNEQNLLTIEDLSRILKTSKHTIYGWVRKKSVPFCKLNGLLRFETDKIEKWLQEHRSE
ncbi:hypothetical protein ES705_05293 [subsurface metagenome]